MKKAMVWVLLLGLITFESSGWGPTGHRVTGFIADKYLTKTAQTIPPRQTYAFPAKNTNGDIIQSIEQLIGELKKRKLTPLKTTPFNRRCAKAHSSYG